MRPRLLPILFVLLTLSALAAASASSQQERGSLTLQVLAHGTREPLGGARGRLSSGAAAIADGHGVIRIRGIAPGSYVLEIRRIGYAPERVLLTFAAGEMIDGELELTPEPLLLDPVEVSAARPNLQLLQNGFYQRRLSLNGFFMTRDEIGLVIARGGQLNTVLRAIPGAALLPASRGGGLVLGRFAGGCPAQVLIDGIAISSGAGRGSLDQLISVEMIEALEWYSGPASVPTEWNRTTPSGGSAICGTLVIWTRGTA